MYVRVRVTIGRMPETTSLHGARTPRVARHYVPNCVSMMVYVQFVGARPPFEVWRRGTTAQIRGVAMMFHMVVVGSVRRRSMKDMRHNEQGKNLLMHTHVYATPAH